jgi:hypothetical protein
MNTCEVCGNDCDKAFQIVKDGKTHVFDSFEGSIHALAPECSRCHCRISGHGMESNRKFFCCAHCANHHGGAQLKDRSGARRHA